MQTFERRRPWCFWRCSVHGRWRFLSNGSAGNVTVSRDKPPDNNSSVCA